MQHMKILIIFILTFFLNNLFYFTLIYIIFFSFYNTLLIYFINQHILTDVSD